MHHPGSRIYTIGHGRRTIEELVECLQESGRRTLVDVRRHPGSRRNPQFNQKPLVEGLQAAGIDYRHTVALGGLRTDEPGQERFECLGPFAGYAARMGSGEWQEALASALAELDPVFMCAETPWQRCHRRFISELLEARGHEVVHLIRPGEREPHRMHRQSDVINGRLYLCGELVA
jgi:uncharacterized protein (DUF488 family)